MVPIYVYMFYLPSTGAALDTRVALDTPQKKKISVASSSILLVNFPGKCRDCVKTNNVLKAMISRIQINELVV